MHPESLWGWCICTLHRCIVKRVRFEASLHCIIYGKVTEKPQYYVENSNPPIVSREVFLAAGAANCQSRRARENAVYDTFCLMVDKLTTHRQDLLGSLIRQLEMLQNRRGENQERIRQIDKQIADLSAQNLVVARLHTNGVLNAADFAAQSSVISNKINGLCLDRKKVLAQDEDDELIYTLKPLDNTLTEYVPGSPFNQELLEQIIESITVVDNANLTFHLAGGLSLTEQIQENTRCGTA